MDRQLPAVQNFEMSPEEREVKVFVIFLIALEACSYCFASLIPVDRTRKDCFLLFSLQ